MSCFDWGASCFFVFCWHRMQSPSIDDSLNRQLVGNLSDPALNYTDERDDVFSHKRCSLDPEIPKCQVELRQTLSISARHSLFLCLNPLPKFILCFTDWTSFHISWSSSSTSKMYLVLSKKYLLFDLITIFCHPPLSSTVFTQRCHPPWSLSVVTHLCLLSVVTHHCHALLSPTIVIHHCHPPLSPTIFIDHCDLCCHPPLSPSAVTLHCHQLCCFWLPWSVGFRPSCFFAFCCFISMISFHPTSNWCLGHSDNVTIEIIWFDFVCMCVCFCRSYTLLSFVRSIIQHVKLWPW